MNYLELNIQGCTFDFVDTITDTLNFLFMNQIIKNQPAAPTIRQTPWLPSAFLSKEVIIIQDFFPTLNEVLFTTYASDGRGFKDSYTVCYFRVKAKG